MKTNTYSLQLADNQGWNIMFSEEVGDFFSPIPDIAFLSPFFCENAGQAIFYEKKYEGSNNSPLEMIPYMVSGGIPRHGWRKNECFACDYWLHPECDNIFGFLDLNHKDIKESGISSLLFWKSFLLFNPLLVGIQRRNGLHLHGALVEYQGMGAIIAAPGSTGKSTTCRRLPGTWKVHCDDNTLVVRGENGRLYAHPLPTWSDYIERNRLNPVNVQTCVQLGGIFFLEQADCNVLSPMPGNQAAACIFDSATQIGRGVWKILNEENRPGYHRLAVSRSIEVSREIPAYRFRLSLTGNFWEMLEAILGKCSHGFSLRC